MPTTINGIGTHYYGKRNLESETGQCESCGNYAELQTYETTLFFVVIYIPLIPLGKKQIIDDCTVCRRHRVLPAKEWQNIREQAIGSSQSQLAEKMDDPKAAIEHMQTLTAFQQKDEARDLSGILEKTHAQDFDVQFFLAIWHEKYGDSADSDRCFDNAYRIDPENPIAVRAKAVGLMEQGEPEKAEGMLGEFKHPSELYDPTLFFTLAKSYQAANQNERALELYSELMEHVPGIEKEKPFRDSVRQSEKAMFRPDSILPKKSLLGSSGFRWAAAIVALLIGLFVWNMYIAGNRTVRVVNGVTKPITITIDDGEATTIQPATHQDIPLGEGSHSVTYTDPTGAQQTDSFEMGIPFFQRFFSKPSFVLNPTRTAIVFKETTLYSASAIEVDNTYETKLGELMTQFDNSDYGYDQFPEQLKVSSNTSRRILKTRVDYMPFSPGMLFTDTLKAAPDQKMQAMENFLAYQSDITSLSMYVAVAELNEQRDRCMKFLESKLETVPVNVHMHRMFQTIAEKNQVPEKDLIERYDGYLQKNPNDSVYLYLRGRLENSVKESRTFMEKAIVVDANNSFAHGAIAFSEMVSGDFQAAAKSYNKAIELSPENEQLKDQYVASLFATEQFDELKSLLNFKPQMLHDFRATSKYLKASGNEAQRHSLKNAILAQNIGDTSLDARADLYWNYLNKDNAAYGATMAKLTNPMLIDMAAFEHAVETEDPAKVEQTVGKLKNLPLDSGYQILSAIVQHRAGDKKAAVNQWQDCIALLKSRSGADHFAAELIEESANREITTEEFLQVSMQIPQKKVIALAMLEFECKVASDWKELIAKLNFDLDFPHNFIERCLQ